MPSLWEAQLRHANHFENILRNADNLYLRGRDTSQQGLALFDLNWNNIQQGQAWAEYNCTIERQALQLTSAYAEAGVNALLLRRKPRDILQWLHAGLRAAKELKNPKAESILLSALSTTYRDLGDTTLAIESGEQALTIIGDRFGRATVLMNLGDAHLDSGDYQRASERYEQALTIFRGKHDLRGQATALGKLGIVQKQLNAPRRAIKYYYRQLTIARKIGDRQNEGAALANLGVAYVGIGNPDRAVQLLSQALLIAREIGYSRDMGTSLYNLSLLLKDSGQSTQAVIYARTALEVYEQIEDPRADGVRNRLAEWDGER